jgi:RNA polymerase sigma factor (sigma-70 family)
MTIADNELLRRYHANRSEKDFAELVSRHGDLVYAVALRQLNCNADLACDVTQTVFTDLARKAAEVLARGSVPGWLYISARFASAKLLRTEQRRRQREQLASEMMEMNTPAPGFQAAIDPSQLRPIIDLAMEQLDADDRDAVLLRFFEGRDFKSVGVCLGISGEAARKRVLRATERLRQALQHRGINSSDSALASALGGAVAISIPADLRGSILTSALGVSGEAAPSAFSAFFSLNQMKTSILLAGLAAGLGTTSLVQHSSNTQLRAENEMLASELAVLRASAPSDQSSNEYEVLLNELARLRHERSELLRLRDEVTRLRAHQRQEVPAMPAVPDELQALATQQISIEAKFIEAPLPLLARLSMDAIGLNITGSGATAILTESQFKELIRALESDGSVDMFAVPKLTTLHNRAGSISILAKEPEGDLPVGQAGFESADNAVEKDGHTVEILPVISQDLESITLHASARAKSQEMERDTAVSGSCVLWDGQTMVLSQPINRSGRGLGPGLNEPAALVVFVTPVLIDPAGNRLKAEISDAPLWQSEVVQ